MTFYFLINRFRLGTSVGTGLCALDFFSATCTSWRFVHANISNLQTGDGERMAYVVFDKEQVEPQSCRFCLSLETPYVGRHFSTRHRCVAPK